MSMVKGSLRIPRPEFWTAVSTSVLAATTVVALWVARSQLREFHAESQVQHLIALTQQFEQEPMTTYRRGLAEKRLKNERDLDELYRVLDFFDNVGLLVRRGYLDESDVWATFGYWVLSLNADARDIVEQEQRVDPTTYADFSSLAERLQRIEIEQHGTYARPSKEEVTDFYRLELTTGVSIRTHGHPVKQPAK